MGKDNLYGLNDRVLTDIGDLLTTQIDDETVMMSIERGKYYALDAVANHIWTLIQKPVKIGVLIHELQSVYESDPGEVEKDVLTFLNQLENAGMVRVETAASY